LDEDLRHIERLLRRDRTAIESPAWHVEPGRSLRNRDAGPAVAEKAPSSRTMALRNGVAWLLICTGLAAFVCGVVLLAWTWLGGRGDLLIPGLACAAAGQFGLLGGFLIQPNQPTKASGPGAEPPPASDSPHWLDLHRRIDALLRADLPPGRGS
jgi:hypothetical protein